MYRLAEIEDIDQIAELKTSNPEAVKVYHKVGFKDNNSMKLEMFL